jgi:hypothetical protein
MYAPDALAVRPSQWLTYVPLLPSHLLLLQLLQACLTKQQRG